MGLRQAPLPSGRKLAAALALIVVLTTALYWRTRPFEFVWDDAPQNLAGNPAVMTGDYAFFWRQPYLNLYVPVTYDVWTAIASVSRSGADVPLQPAAFRTVNILLHSANAALVLLLAHRLVGSVGAAVAGALVFAVHPLQVESVVWITELRGLLATFFSLLALVLYSMYRNSRRRVLIVLSTMSFVFASLSKPTALVFPAVIAVWEWCRPPASRVWRWSALWLLLAVPFMAMTLVAQPASSIASSTRPIWERPLVVGDTVAFYLWKLAVPTNLSASYGRTPAAVMANPLSWLLWTVPLLLAWTVWRLNRGEEALRFGIALVLIALAPVSGLVPFLGQNVSTTADRYFYLPMVGVACVVAGAVEWAVFRRSLRLTYILLPTMVMALGYAMLTIRQQDVWRDELSLWEHAATTYPRQADAHNNYAVALQAVHRHREAIQACDRAIAVRPDLASAYANRGISWAQLDQLGPAIDDLTRSLELDPTRGSNWLNRAVAYYHAGRLDAAFADLSRAESLGANVPPRFRDQVVRALPKN